MIEEWTSVKNYPNYEISNLGRVRNNKGRILQVRCSFWTSYKAAVVLSKDGVSKTKLIKDLLEENFKYRLYTNISLVLKK